MSCTVCKSENSLTVTDYASLVCLECGHEKKHSIDIKNHQNFADNPANAYNQLYFTYSRKHRFKNYVDQVVGISSGCHATAEIWSLLEKHAPFNTVPDLLKCMSHVKCKHKHYECIHSFSKAFVKSYKRPEPISLKIIKRIKNRFDNILLHWKKCYFRTNELFFSYPWLIMEILHEQNIRRYDIFIKKLRCKKRVIKYKKMLTRIYGKPIRDETPLLRDVYVPSVVHSQKNVGHPKTFGNCELLARSLLKNLVQVDA